MTPRERTERREAEHLHARACLAARAAERERPEPPCPARTAFQRDVDRITHSKSFRRLMYKTQVFLCPGGDHYRTRLTHALEVSRIARTVARGLSLNEDLTEAVALGHDLGHAPFGHAGERALNEVVPGGFAHNTHSRRVVECLERGGEGLNLCPETRAGIECHTGPELSASLEGRIVRIADRIAYVNHDMDDAVRAGLLTETELPAGVRQTLGASYSMRIDTLVRDMLEASSERLRTSPEPDIVLSPPVAEAMEALRAFMFERVYLNSRAKSEETKAISMIQRLYEHYAASADRLTEELWPLAERDGTERAAADFVAGMTDRYALETAQGLFLPHGWEKR
ncbi:MAG: deoxyguanosinetriphosphate triphosphohydrolase [Oscillospiraceae bacterium]|nr:deoxyguanosinetriphosphate triphosphohydrolase [Oscillospiraceae bacterium]